MSDSIKEKYIKTSPEPVIIVFVEYIMIVKEQDFLQKYHI